MTTGDHSGWSTGNGTHNDHFGDPAPRPPRRPGPRAPTASDWWLFPGAWPRGAARGAWRPPGCARRTSAVVRAQQPEPRPALSLPVIGAFILGGGPSGGRGRAAAASVRCDLLPPGLFLGPRPRHGHGGLVSAAARTSRGAEGKGGPGRAGSREPAEGGARAAALTVTSSRPGTPLTPFPGPRRGRRVGGRARGAARVPATPATAPSGAGSPGTSGVRSGPPTGVGAAGAPRRALSEPLRTVSLLLI